MNPTWGMVLSALLAGVVGGFMIPVRPEIRDVPALTKTAEPAKVLAADKASAVNEASAADKVSAVDVDKASGKDGRNVRKIPLTAAAATASRAEADAQQTKPQETVAGTSCSSEVWPYRAASCLDRSATVANAGVVVDTKRIEPTVSLVDTGPVTQAAGSQQNVASAPEPAQSTPKPDQEQAAPEPEAQQQAAAETEADDDDNEARSARPAPKRKRTAARSNDNKRPARRSGRRTQTNLHDGIPTRVYLRGPDGRLYLAPRYQFERQPRHHIMP